jgi:hypothetical protein
MTEVKLWTTPVEICQGLWLTRKEIRSHFDALLDRLISLAQAGSKDSRRRLEEIYKLLQGEYFVNVPRDSPVGRAAFFYRLMHALSMVVLPVNENEPRLINKPVYLNSSKRGAEPVGVYEFAEKHWKRRCTLRSLTMRAFFESIGREDTPDAQRILNRDLKAFRKWESDLPSELVSKVNLSSGEEIPLYIPLDPPLLIPPRRSKG